LKDRGIGPGIIEEVLRTDFPPEREREIIREAAAGGGNAKRTAGRLLRNGFDPDLVEEIVLSSLE
jgi:hypothetical protein